MVQYLTPLGLMIRHLIEAIFHLRGKIVVHQIAEVLFQAIGDNLTHFLGVEAAVFHPHVAAILNGRNDRRIGRRPADTPFFQLFDQRGFAKARRRFGKVLCRSQFDQAQALALVDDR